MALTSFAWQSEYGHLARTHSRHLFNKIDHQFWRWDGEAPKITFQIRKKYILLRRSLKKQRPDQR